MQNPWVLQQCVYRGYSQTDGCMIVRLRVHIHDYIYENIYAAIYMSICTRIYVQICILQCLWVYSWGTRNKCRLYSIQPRIVGVERSMDHRQSGMSIHFPTSLFPLIPVCTVHVCISFTIQHTLYVLYSVHIVRHYKPLVPFIMINGQRTLLFRFTHSW